MMSASGQRQALPGAVRSIAAAREGFFPSRLLYKKHENSQGYGLV